MKVDFGNGAYLESDDEPRDTVFHKRITRVSPLPNTRSGHMVTLECGHRAMTFGDLDHCGGVVLCTECRDRAEDLS